MHFTKKKKTTKHCVLYTPLIINNKIEIPPDFNKPIKMQ